MLFCLSFINILSLYSAFYALYYYSIIIMVYIIFAVIV